MQRPWWVALIVLVLLLSAAIDSNQVGYPDEPIAHQCVRIYADSLPKDVRVSQVEQDGQDLVVHIYHLGWTGEIRCLLYRDNSLDDVGTLDRKYGVRWSEPPMPWNP